MSSPIKKPYEPFKPYEGFDPATDPNMLELRALQMAATEADRKAREKFNEMFELIGEKTNIPNWRTTYVSAKYRSLSCKIGEFLQGPFTIYKRIK